MQPFIALAITIGVLIVFRLALHLGQRHIRRQAFVAQDGEMLIRQVDNISVRIMSNASIAGGPVAGRIIQTTGAMVLFDSRFVVATNQGPMLEMSSEFSGEARAVGGRRLVVLGKHPTGRADLRLEIIVDNEEEWAEQINARFHSGESGLKTTGEIKQFF